MDPLVYTFQPLAIPLRAAFTQASRHRVASESVWATARRGDVVGVGEGCPRTYQTGEDVTSALAWPPAGTSTFATVEPRVSCQISSSQAPG